MKIDINDFSANKKKKIRLKEWPTEVAPYYRTKADYRRNLAFQVEELSELQRKLYADDHYSLLLIFQSMDAAGKDGAIRHVMSGVNPQGCQVYSFKHPSENELEHDFLWRTSQCLPDRGRIGIFNRSYYEEVLIVRVHPEILKAQRIPEELIKKNKVWEDRYRSIIDHEQHLSRNGTRIVKFFLHLSKEEQRKRFLERIDEPDKNWKFSMADINERQYWDQYMDAYAACLEATSTEEAPWYIVPADDKENARLIISEIIVETLKDMPIKFPKVDKARQKELQEIRKQLVDEE